MRRASREPHLTTNDNGIAKEYQASKLQPWRTHVERHTFLTCPPYTAPLRLIDAKPIELPLLSAVGLLRHADLLDHLQDVLASPHLNLDLSKLRCDLLSEFLLSAWHLLPPLACSRPRFSLWKWCC
jgi:hypothetical protein